MEFYWDSSGIKGTFTNSTGAVEIPLDSVEIPLDSSGSSIGIPLDSSGNSIGFK